MSKKVRIIICSVLVLIAFGAGLFAYAHTQLGQKEAANAEEGLPNYLVDKYGKIRVPVEPTAEELGGADPRDSRGTENNPLFVLEVVPYEGMAEFGYHISGCEPIDVDAAARDMGTLPVEIGSYYSSESHTFRYWKGEEPVTFRRNQIEKITQYGTMTYVGDGSGNYKMTSTYVNGDDLTKETYEKVGDGENGDYLWEPLSAEDCAAMTYEQGAEYREEYKGERTAGTSYKMYFEQVECYANYSGKILTHKNTFLRESVGLAYEFDANGVRHKITDENKIKEKIDAYHAVVYTVTPEDLNMNPELIDRADLLIISPKANAVGSVGSCSNGMYTYLQAGVTDIYDANGKILSQYESDYKYYPYLKKHLFGYEATTGDYVRKENKPGASFKTNLIDWSIVARIADRAMSDTYILPVVMENLIFQNAFSGADSLNKNVQVKAMYADGSVENIQSHQGTQENMAKLYLLLNQMKSSTFRSLYGNVGDASNAYFTTQDMKVNETTVKMKNGAKLQTGVFNYDKGRAHDKKGNSGSRAYWYDFTLIPWHLLPTTGYASPANYAKAVAVFGVTCYSDGYSMTSGDAQNIMRNGLMGFSDNGKLTTGLDTLPCAIKNNIFGAQLYEYFDAINGDDPAPPESGTVADGALSMADCLFYLLNGVNGGPTPVNDTTQFKVLELQPSSNYEAEDFWSTIITTYCNSITEPLVDQMTTSEFIGSHVECISEYDLIYIGMKKSTQDPTMQFTDGTNFVYAHTGPKVKVGTGFRAIFGWLRSDKISGITDDKYNKKEENFAYSGNDLTSLAFDKLKEYHDAGFPIMFGNGFYSDISTYKAADTVDRNSNIFKLGELIKSSGTKAVYYGDLGSNATKTENFRKALTSNSKKVQMVFYANGLPLLYDSTKTDAKDKYINGENNSNRTLRFKFYLKAPAGTSYQVKLYVDTNTDGSYDPVTEDMGVTIYNSAGNGVYGGSVEAGKTYTVERQITNRIGSLPWKLDLIKDGKVYASQSGVSAIQKGPGDEVISIRVLQIVPDSATISLSLPMSQEDANAIGGASKKFYEKIQTLDCFAIQFVRMNQTQVMNVINGVGGAAPQSDYLYQNYDMLVLGFADMYDGVSDGDLLAKIENFITRGKAVLYTHDTSSTIGRSGSSFSVWGSNVTKAYRDMFGMDRYGAKKYFDSDTGSISDIPSDKDKPYAPSTSSTGTMYKNEDGVPLIQGLSNGLLFRAKDTHVRANLVSKVNNGAITQYPFTIPDSISVASTHPQYYQLDMEREDIVVWYCLDVGSSGSAKEKLFFGQNKNDVRNNYYIYNIGNVTYSGMGHYDGSTSNALSLTDLEIELFINTFVAAYRAPALGVPVKVTNDDVTSNPSGEQFLCVDVDSSNATEIIGIDIVDRYYPMEVDGAGYKKITTPVMQASKRVYFYLNDTNAFGGNSEYTVTMKLNGSDAQAMLAVYRASDGKFIDTQTIDYENGVIYYVDVPITIDTVGTSSSVGKTELKVTVEMTYYVGGEPFEAEARTTTINILPRGLYDLN